MSYFTKIYHKISNDISQDAENLIQHVKSHMHSIDSLEYISRNILILQKSSPGTIKKISELAVEICKSCLNKMYSDKMIGHILFLIKLMQTSKRQTLRDYSYKIDKELAKIGIKADKIRSAFFNNHNYFIHNYFIHKDMFKYIPETLTSAAPELSAELLAYTSTNKEQEEYYRSIGQKFADLIK